MSSITLFFIFIPLLAFILLAINLTLAPHNPYQEKDSPFECGFSSFLAQNRTQFNISFYIFALLFLLFDLEVLLIYPYVVSAYNNDVYGLVVMLVFFIILTLGFVFELGKGALKITSRQNSLHSKLPDTKTIAHIGNNPDLVYTKYKVNNIISTSFNTGTNLKVSGLLQHRFYSTGFNSIVTNSQEVFNFLKSEFSLKYKINLIISETQSLNNCVLFIQNWLSNTFSKITASASIIYDGLSDTFSKIMASVPVIYGD